MADVSKWTFTQLTPQSYITRCVGLLANHMQCTKAGAYEAMDENGKAMGQYCTAHAKILLAGLSIGARPGLAGTGTVERMEAPTQEIKVEVGEQEVDIKVEPNTNNEGTNTNESSTNTDSTKSAS